jgi:hypothetical protein
MKYILPLIFSIATFLLLGIPFLILGADKTFFYSTDPDVVYVANALLYTKSAVITYADHPGTPMIMLLSILFFPLRLYTKLILGQNFISWSFDNFAILVFGLRLFQLFLYTASVFLLLKAVGKISKSNVLVFLSWAFVLAFTGSNYSLIISPETLSFFLTALWLTVFTVFIKKPAYILSLVLVAISGIAVANKFTSLFLLVSSLGLPLFVKDPNYYQKIVRFILNSLVGISMFFFGIWPAIMRLDWIKSWVRSLFLFSGKHGTGIQAVFDWNTYIASVRILIFGNWYLTILIGITGILATYLLVRGKIKISYPVVWLNAMSFVGLMTFAKYPVLHYSYVNLLLTLFCLLYYLSKVDYRFVRALTFGVMIILVSKIWGFSSSLPERLAENRDKSVYVELNTWTTPYWSGNLYREELEEMGFKP